MAITLFKHHQPTSRESARWKKKAKSAPAVKFARRVRKAGFARGATAYGLKKGVPERTARRIAATMSPVGKEKRTLVERAARDAVNALLKTIAIKPAKLLPGSRERAPRQNRWTRVTAQRVADWLEEEERYARYGLSAAPSRRTLADVVKQIEKERRAPPIKIEGAASATKKRHFVLLLRQKPARTVFMQDGATCHTCKKVRDYLDEVGVEYVKGWPAHSPELNPIEQVWAYLNRFVTDNYAPTVDRTQLMRNVKDAWEKIPTAVINEFVMSFESKLKQAVAAGGR